MTILIADNTNVSDLTPLKNLINLQQLIIDNTSTNDLTPLERIVNLKQLSIFKTKITNLKPLEKLIGLKTLDLRWNNISDLSGLENLENLKILKLFNNKITDLSLLSNLINLDYLSLDDNPIEDLKPILPLIKRLPVSLEKYSFKNGIYVNNCPLKNPPIFIVGQGNEAILRHWQDIENKETQINNQTKLIFIGNSRAGKTSLWQFLKDKTYNDKADSTHGIKTEIWDEELLGIDENTKLVAHIWDFGGQEYYHATHRLFLSDNAVYVLVWEKDSNKPCTSLEKVKFDDDPNEGLVEVELEHFPVSYWLENIRYYGKDSKTLIVQNKVDDDTLICFHTEGVNDLSNCAHLSIQNAYLFQEGQQQYEDFYGDFKKFKNKLLNLLRANALFYDKVLKYHIEVRERLEDLAKTNDFIDFNDFEKIVLEFDKDPYIPNLLSYLKNFTNTVLYFPQNPLLKDRLYLNPTHISRDIYKILNKTVRENNGKFDLGHIQTRLNCDASEAERFVALMREFDLIFEKERTIKGETKQQFTTPQYLPKKEDLSDDIQFLIEGYSFERAFTIQFKSFVPRSLMLRFIVHNGALSNQETYWRNGIIYKSPTTQLMVKVEYDHEALTFMMSVQNKAQQTIDMQNIVEQFVTLESSDEHIKISNDGKFYVDLRTIRKLHLENRREDIYIDGNIVYLKEFNWLITKLKTEKSMTLEELKNQVRTLISKAKTKDAMDTVAIWAHEHNQEQLKDDINLLKSELTTLNRNITLGLVSHSDTIIQQNQLNNKVMSLLNTIEVSESKTYIHLENVQPKETIHKKTMAKPLSIFISYSKNDNDLRQELHTHLSSLRRRNIVSNWDDRHIIGGELWDDTIKTKLREADIILFLVSASFINTDYIWDHEIPIAEEQRRNGKARVIPIILKPCQWTKLDFAKQQALPSKGVPINSFPDRDTAWLEVVESIEKVINDVMS